MRRAVRFFIGVVMTLSAPFVSFAADNKKEAQEFLKDFIAQKTKPPKIPLSGITSTRGKDYLRHEEALELISQKRLLEASALYEEIVLDNPEDDEAYVLLGHTYLLSGQYRRAEIAFGNALHIHPDNVNEILPFYQNFVLQNPDDDKNYTYLGYASWMLGHTEKAKEAFQEALRINPGNQDAQNGLAELQRRN